MSRGIRPLSRPAPTAPGQEFEFGAIRLDPADPATPRCPADRRTPPPHPLFQGHSVHKLDAKGRVFIPKRITQELPVDGEGGRTVVLAPGLGGCLNLFSDADWKTFTGGLNLNPYGEDGEVEAARLLLGTSQTIALDASKRLLIPEPLRAMASLSDEVALVGVGTRVELWDAPTWTELQSKRQPDLDQLLKKLGQTFNRPAGDGPAA